MYELMILMVIMRMVNIMMVMNVDYDLFYQASQLQRLQYPCGDSWQVLLTF